MLCTAKNATGVRARFEGFLSFVICARCREAQVSFVLRVCEFGMTGIPFRVI